MVEIDDHIPLKIKTGCCTIYAAFVENKEKNFKEIKLDTNSKANCLRGRINEYQHFVNALYGKGVSLEEIRDLFDGRKCDNIRGGVAEGDPEVKSCSDGVSQLIKKYLEEKANAKNT